MPESEAERGKYVVSTGCGGREVVLAELAVILHADPPELQMSAVDLNGISRNRVCDELVRFADMSFACCFPYSDLEGAETKMVVCLGEAVGKVTSAVQIKSIAHEKAEGGFFTASRLVPLKAASFVLVSSGPELGGLGKRDHDFLITDGRRMVHKNAEMSVYAEDRESESIEQACIRASDY